MGDSCKRKNDEMHSSVKLVRTHYALKRHIVKIGMKLKPKEDGNSNRRTIY